MKTNMIIINDNEKNEVKLQVTEIVVALGSVTKLTLGGGSGGRESRNQPFGSGPC